jgi:hypothetical protein
MSARQRDRSLGEAALTEWAGWVHSCHDAQGWGGGVDVDVIENIIYGKPQRSGHSDPALAELIATECGGQALSQRVHRHLLRYSREFNRDWFRVTWARYVGRPQAKTWKVIRAAGTVELADRYALPITMRGQAPLHWRWSGRMEWPEVATHCGMSVRTAETMLSAVKRQLEMDLRLDRATRTGAHLPDGLPSAKEAANSALAADARSKAA